MEFLYIAIAVVASYLIGSLSFAVIVSRAMRLDDPRTYGSRNPGATNVLRSGNKAAAAFTLLLDALKGALPVWLVQIFGPRFGLGDDSVALAGLAAFLGHLWPVFFGFKGGKGVATAAGVLLGFNPWLGLATLATWVIIAAFFRYSSLAAVVSAAFAPLYQLLIWGADGLALAIGVMSLLLIWRHGANIRRLLDGTESKIGKGKSRGKPAATAAESENPSRRGKRPHRHHSSSSQHHHHRHKEAK